MRRARTKVPDSSAVGAKGGPFPGPRRGRPSGLPSLAVFSRRLAAEWHPTRNAPLTPRDVPAGTLRKVWWKCPKGPDHVWQASVGMRARSPGCPFCTSRRVSVTNSLAALQPRLAAEWHPSKNGTLQPQQVAVGSERKVWWRCASDRRHEWPAAVCSRARRGHGCPFCAGRRVLPTESVAARFPALAAQWHPTRNGSLRPEHAPVCSSRRVWWRCPKGPDHEWQAATASRTAPARSGHRPGRCPFCANRLVSVTNCLAARRPDLVRQWHPTRNRGLTPVDVMFGSARKVWWRCPEGEDHEWRASVCERSVENTGCPFCRGRRVSVTNSLARLRPDLAAEWHTTRNGGLTPAQVTLGTNLKVWWWCARNPRHLWAAPVKARARDGAGCPYCSHRLLLPGDSLAARSPRIAAQWHRTRNGRLRPDEVRPRSHQPVWWCCPQGRDHVWAAPVCDRTSTLGRCPFCAGLRVSVTNSLASLHPGVAREWHPTRNRDLRPAQVRATARAEHWWLCPRGHSWRASPRSRTAGGRACPVCAEGLAIAAPRPGTVARRGCPTTSPTSSARPLGRGGGDGGAGACSGAGIRRARRGRG
ncbi:MAG: zinc-ribbon domain-containing protein [Deltaproteobacteria bacterium]|nr:zinc-ribbon domain-containing protein [Deltaproteobacteria bacterium]